MTFGPRCLRRSLGSSFRLTALFAVSSLTFVASGWVVGCGDDTGGGNGGNGTGGQVSLAGVVYEGGATDEALEALVATPAKTVASEAAAFTEPADGAMVPIDPAPTFKWAISGGGARLAPEELLQLPGGHTETREPGFLERFLHAREAHAHGVPISGRAYFVTFSDTSGAAVLRVFTQKLEYTPAADALEKLAVAGAVKAEVVNAIFEENRIVTDGGPFTGTPRSFSVTR